MTDARRYPDRPFLAASAAIVRDGKVLVVRRARPPAGGLFSLPGGVVEVGETLHEAVAREVREETSLTIEPVLNDELSEWRWVEQDEIASLPTTPGLAAIVAAAFERLAAVS